MSDEVIDVQVTPVLPSVEELLKENEALKSDLLAFKQDFDAYKRLHEDDEEKAHPSEGEFVNKFEWEKVYEANVSPQNWCVTSRGPVPGGWLYRHMQVLTDHTGYSATPFMTMTLVPE